MNHATKVLLCWLLVSSIIVSSGMLVSADDLPGVNISSGPYLDKIVYNIITHDDQQIQALMDDEVDLIGDMVDQTFLDTLREANDIEVANVLRNGYGYLVINTAKYPLNITDFRRAFAFALDKEAISEDVWDGLSIPVDSCVPLVNPYSIEGQLDYSYYEANVALGDQLLDAAGFADIDDDGIREAPDGSEFDVLIECAQSSNIAIEVGQKAADALTALGIDAVSTPTDFYEYLHWPYFYGDFDMVFLGRSFNNFDVDWLAYEYWSEYADDPYWNFANWRNSTYDGWRDQLLHSTDYEDVYEAAIEMQKIWVHACPEVICYNNKLLSAYRTDRFEGFVNDANEGVPGWWTYYKARLSSANGGPYGGTLRLSIPLDIDSFNIMVSSSAETTISSTETRILGMLYDSLIRIDPEGNDIPWLAESYSAELHADNPSVPDGYTRFTINLIQNATWSDGQPLTAIDAAYTLNYYHDAPGNPLGADLTEMSAAYSPSRYTLIVEFSTESYWHLHSFCYKPIMPKHVLEDIGLDEWNIWNPNPLDNPMVLSGPYYVSDYVAGEFVEISYNPDYFYGFDRPQDPGTVLSITPAPDVLYDLGDTGNTISWFISSSTDYDYEIYRDGSIIDSGSGSDASIEISVDGLQKGVHNYTLKISNEKGLEATDSVFVIVTYDITGTIVFDYSHGQNNAAVTPMDDWLIGNLTALGYECVIATGGINQSILADATGFVAGAIYGEENGYDYAEISAISTWFNTGSKFMWIGLDSDYAGYQYINDNMTAILQAVRSHVYGEPLSVEDPVNNCGAGNRPYTTSVGTSPVVAPIVLGVEEVLMHSPTCLYGSTSGECGINPVSLETTVIDNVYPLLYYGETATIVDSDHAGGFAHEEYDFGAFVAAALELNAGSEESSVLITSGASPYRDYYPMSTDEYYVYDLTGMLFVLQAINYGMLLTELNDFMTPVLTHPADFEFVVGTLGNQIEWEGESSNPSSYIIYLNGTVYSSGSWNSSSESFVVDLDALMVGEYNFTIVVSNAMGIESSDTVMVKAIGQPGVIDQIIMNLNIIVTMGSLVVIVIVLGLTIKSKGAGASPFNI